MGDNFVVNVIRRAGTSLRQQGLGNSIAKLGTVIIDQAFDVRYGLDTCARRELADLTVVGGNKGSGYRYQPTRLLVLDRLFGMIATLLPPAPVLVDYGCGKGRVLLAGLRYGFREVRGIEFARELCEIARRNCAVYAAKTGSMGHFDVIEADAVDYEVRENDNVLFFFNPFGWPVLEKVLDNIERSLNKCDRTILLVYYNPWHQGCIEASRIFRQMQEFSFWGHRFVVYSNSHTCARI